MTYSNDNTKHKNTSKPKKEKKVVDINIHKFNPKEFEKESTPYTLICNKVIQECTNPVAGFIWVYLQSRPITWLPCRWEIMKRFNISEPTYKRHMQYLKSCGLIECHQPRCEDGTVGVTRLVVLNGSRFNSKGDSYKGIIFDVTESPVDNFYDDDRGIKNDPPVNPAPEAASDRGIKNDPAVANRWIKKPVTGEMNPHINTRSSSTKKISHTQGNEVDEFVLEKTLYLDSEQQRKAIAFRGMCIKDEKAKSKHQSLKTDKTYTEMLDECISHYATQLEPQLVSPQRFQSWIARESQFERKAEFNKPTFQTKDERAANELKIRERELKAQEEKRREIEASRDSMNNLKSSMGFAEAQKKVEEEMKRLGMSQREYSAYILKKAKET